jgi:tetratricopeptide (TPR) repeat protein
MEVDNSLELQEILHLAMHAMAEGRHEQAISYLRRLLERQPDHAMAVYLLGAVHAELGMYGRAIEEMTRAVQLAPDALPTASFQLGMLHLGQGQLKEAEQAWEPLDRLPTDDCLQLFRNGMLHFANGRYQDCIRDLQAGIRCNVLHDSLSDDMTQILERARAELAQSEQPAEASPVPAASGHVLVSRYRSDDEAD